jgi:aryl-alcohol dehydrogenase-like predicted oxidoreductase
VRPDPQTDVGIEYRTLGNTGMHVSCLGFGGSELGWDSVPQQDVDRILLPALDAGLNLIDTGECYFDSEEKIGVTLIDRPRDSFYLFTKAGHASGLPTPDWTAETITANIDRSLRRLRLDYLDLVQLHSCSDEILRQGDVIEALERARDAGKTRFIGYSGDGENARYAVETRRFGVLQTSISVADQEAVELTVPLAAELGMGVIAKRPIANVAWRIGQPPEDGHVDTVLDKQGYGDEYARRLRTLDYGLDALPLQEAVATALRFTLTVPSVHTAIVGTTRPGRWQKNARLLAAGALPSAHFETMRARWHEVAEEDWVGME